MKNRNMWPLIMVIVVVFILFIGFGYSGFGPMGSFGGGMMFFPGIFFIFFVVMMFFMMSGKNGGMCGMGHKEHKKSEDDPSKILKNRYAKGEITKKQYEDMKKELEK